MESSTTVAVFPSMKAGSHRTLEAKDRPKLLWSYHDGAEVPPGVIRKYLVKQIGLSEADALALLRG